MRKVLLSLLAVLFCHSGQAYFNDIAEGVRPSGMGSAFVGVADDCNTMLYNPAGLVNVKQVEFIGMYSLLYAGLSFRTYNGNSMGSGINHLAVAVPFSESGEDALGFTWVMLNDEFYKEHTFILSYGFNLIRNLSIGLSAKNYQWQIESSEYTRDSDDYPDRSELFPTLSKSGMTIDLGLLFTTDQNITLGIGIENVLGADVGLWDEQIVPIIYRVGLSYPVPESWLAVFNLKELDDLLLTAEYSYRDTVQNIKFGIESWLWNDLLAVRAGGNLNSFSFGMSYKQYWAVMPIDFQFDYAVNFAYEMQDSWGSHRVGLTLRQHEEPIKAEVKPTPVVTPVSTPMPTPTPETILQVIVPEHNTVKDAVEPVINDEKKVIIGYVKNALFLFSTAQETLGIMEKLKRSVALRSDVDIILVGFKNEAQLKKHLVDNKIDLIISTGFKVDSMMDSSFAQPIAATTNGKKDYQPVSFYVYKDREIKALTDLNGRRVAVVGLKSVNQISGYINHLSTSPDINLIHYNNAPAALLALYMNQIDAIVGPDAYMETTYHNLKRNKMLDASLEKIHQTTVYAKNQQIYMRKTVTSKKRNKILKIYKALTALVNNKESKEWMEFFGFDGLKRVSP